MSFIEEYYNKIKSGQIITGNKIRKLYEKLVDDIHNPKTYPVLQMNGEYKPIKFIFDEKKANRPIEFIEKFCKQSKAPYAGQPLKLELWQKALIQAVYGFVAEDTGYRQYQEVLLEIGRKNGKSTIMAGIGAYHMIVNSGFEICCGANTRSQAEIIFSETKNMLQQNEMLSKRVKKRKYDLYNEKYFNVMKPLANNSNLDGLNTDIFLVDEIHEFKDSVMFDLVKQSQGVKYEPLIFMVTTNGFVRDMFFDNKLDYANNVLNGIIIDHTFLPVLYELDALDSKEANKEIKDKNNWFKTNPSLGTFRSFADVDKLIKQTEHNKNERAKLLAKYFNLPQTGTTGVFTFDDVTILETFNINDFKDCYCIGGVDLSCTNDLTSAALLFMKKDSDKKYFLVKSWTPKDLVAEKEKEDKFPYSRWVNKSYIDLSGDTKINYDDVTNWFIEMKDKYNLYPRWIAYDPYNSKYWIQQMQDTGFEMQEVRQGFPTLSNPLKNMIADVKAKKIIFNNDEVIKWACLNLNIETDKNENIRPVKGKNKKRRIDPFMAMLDAYVVLENNFQDFTNYL